MEETKRDDYNDIYTFGGYNKGGLNEKPMDVEIGVSGDGDITAYENEATPTDTRVSLSYEQERMIKKLPSFRIGDRKINDPRINSDKYLDFKEYEPLTIRNIPFFFWSLGVIFIGFGIVLILNMILYRYNRNFFAGFFGKYFWEYIILFFIFSFGITFFFVAQYESILIDKIKGTILLSKYDTFSCSFNTLEVQIKNINAIFPVNVQTTKNSSLGKSCLTQIGITFDGTSTAYIFKSIFRYFTIKNVIKLRTFLFKHIQSYDEVSEELEGTLTYIDVLQDRIH